MCDVHLLWGVHKAAWRSNQLIYNSKCLLPLTSQNMSGTIVLVTANWREWRLLNHFDGGIQTHMKPSHYPERARKRCSLRSPFKKKMLIWVIWDMMSVQWFMQQMACHPTAWLTSTETLGNSRGSSSLYGPGRGQQSPSTARQNQTPISAFPAFPTNNCQNKQNARQTRFAGRS